MGLSLTPEFLPGETVLKESPATRYYQRGFRGGSSNGKLWLTNQRLIFKAGFGYQMGLPLYNISRVETGVYGLFNFKVVQLTLDNDRQERFSVHEVESWPAAALAAKLDAPPLPQELTKLAEQEKSARRLFLAVVGVMLTMIVLCAAPVVCLAPILVLAGV
jgi:hypothetical protein